MTLAETNFNKQLDVAVQHAKATMATANQNCVLGRQKVAEVETLALQQVAEADARALHHQTNCSASMRDYYQYAQG